MTIEIFPQFLYRELMTSEHELLIVAPYAPPQNTPEALQVHRLLSHLPKYVRVTLVTCPAPGGWIRAEEELAFDELPIDRIELAPFGSNLLRRILGRLPFRVVQVPDAEAWLRWMTPAVLRTIKRTPTAIYSRSHPLSAALLGRQLKKALGVPWIMHLSDPWADSPYRRFSGTIGSFDQSLERECFSSADAITVTTESFAAHYRRKYPDIAERIHVSPNMLPDLSNPVAQPERAGDVDTPGPFRKIVYTGALYGARKPTALLRAVDYVSAAAEAAPCLELHFHGNMTDDIRAEINACPFAFAHPPTSYHEAQRIQSEADILLTIEPDGEHPLLRSFLPSKVLDYAAHGKPILAITPDHSETAQLCAAGFGWAASERDQERIRSLLSSLLRNELGVTHRPAPQVLEKYVASRVASRIISILQSVTKDVPSPR